MLTAFLAGPVAAREVLRAAATDLRTVGWTVQARWLDDDTPAVPATTAPVWSDRPKHLEYLAAACLEDVEAADVVVVFTAAAALPASVRAATMAATVHAHLDGTAPGHLPGASGGRHVEVGYALGIGRDVVLVGQPENIYQRLAAVQTHPDWHTALTALAGRLVSHERSTAMGTQAALRGYQADLERTLQDLTSVTRIRMAP